MFTFTKPEMKRSKRDQHEYQSAGILVNNVQIGWVTKHSPVLYAVALPSEGKNKYEWRRFESRQKAIDFIKANIDKAVEIAAKQTPLQQTTLGF